MDVALITAISAAAGAVLSGIATTIAIVVAYKVHKNQKLLSQRQLLLPLWDYIATLSKVNSNTPITPDSEINLLLSQNNDNNILRKTSRTAVLLSHFLVAAYASRKWLWLDGRPNGRTGVWPDRLSWC